MLCHAWKWGNFAQQEDGGNLAFPFVGGWSEFCTNLDGWKNIARRGAEDILNDARGRGRPCKIWKGVGNVALL